MNEYYQSFKTLKDTDTRVQTKIVDYLKTHDEMNIHQVNVSVAQRLKTW